LSRKYEKLLWKKDKFGYNIVLYNSRSSRSGKRSQLVEKGGNGGSRIKPSQEDELINL